MKEKEKNKINQITIEEKESYLRQISKVVNLRKEKDLNTEVKILEQFSIENDALAMAAVQLGIPKRLIYVRNTNLDIINKVQNNTISKEEKEYNEAKVLINPIILKREGLTDYWEACASCLDFCGRVLRPYKMEVEYLDLMGNKKQETWEGFASTVLSHEMDHLDGILHIDIAEEVLKMPPEERKKWRQTHPYHIYFKNGDYELLKKEMLQDKKA